MTKICIKNI